MSNETKTKPLPVGKARTIGKQIAILLRLEPIHPGLFNTPTYHTNAGTVTRIGLTMAIKRIFDDEVQDD